MIRSGKESSRKLNRARILLKADEGLQDYETAEALNRSTATVARVRKRFVEEGFEAALTEKPRPGARPISAIDYQMDVLGYKIISFCPYNLSEIIPRLIHSSTNLFESIIGRDFSVYFIEVKKVNQGSWPIA